MKVKMCGLYRPEDIDYANEVQPDYVGFVFYAKSHRAVTKEQAADISRKASEPGDPDGGCVRERGSQE